MATAVREVLSVLGSTASRSEARTSADPSSEGKLDKAMGAWQQARERVIDDLDEFIDAVTKARYEESDKAVILLRAIRANLTASPDTLRQVAELDSYLKSDPIIGHAEMKNGFGITVRIREPLLSALAELKPHLSE